MRAMFVVVLLALPLAGWTQTIVTEADAVRLVLERAEIADLEQSALLAAEAEVATAQQWPNPSLSYSRETLGSSPEAIEESWMLSQTFDLSGRRGLRREAAGQRLVMAQAGNTARRADLSAEIRRAFHEVLFRQEVIRVTTAWVGHFERVEGMIDRLARAGEASGYDRRRLARERRSAAAQLAAQRAELGRDIARLVAFTGSTGDLVAVGDLLPPALLPLEDAARCLEQRPDLQVLARRAEAAELEGRVAGRGAFPDVTLGIGSKRVDNGVTVDDGVMLSVSVPLPLFDRQQAGAQRARAEAMQARAELGLKRAHAIGEVQGLQQLADSLRTTALDYRQRAVADLPELIRIAEAAYQGGESTLLELLDAHRSALETYTEVLDLERRARLASIEFDLLTGSSQCKP